MTAEQTVSAFYQALLNSKKDPSDIKTSDNMAELKQCVSDTLSWYSSYPLAATTSIDEFLENVWCPLTRAFPDIERRVWLSVAQNENETEWVCDTGYFVGTFRHSWLGLPANNKTIYLRFTEMVAVQQGKVERGYIIFDMIDLFDQLGINPIRASLGKAGPMMPPADAQLAYNFDQQSAKKTEQLVKSMLHELSQFDGKSLTSMRLERFWHPDFMWYGPAGIGTTRGIDGFRQHHQGPFVYAFPDRSIDHSLAFISRGNLAATGGWPHMHGTHTGHNWLGLPATGKQVSLRVMDIWRREGEWLRENWVAIDIPHILAQMGLDLFAPYLGKTADDWASEDLLRSTDFETVQMGGAE